MNVVIESLGIDQADVAIDWVSRLLSELGEEGEEAGTLNRERILHAWRRDPERFHVLVARDAAGGIAGILTLIENFAFYANGHYGIINEMLVAPTLRGSGIGARLIDSAKEFGRTRGWKRIDVTAPESERWRRTRRFYEKQGFVFAGPKLKMLLE